MSVRVFLSMAGWLLAAPAVMAETDVAAPTAEPPAAQQTESLTAPLQEKITKLEASLQNSQQQLETSTQKLQQASTEAQKQAADINRLQATKQKLEQNLASVEKAQSSATEKLSSLEQALSEQKTQASKLNVDLEKTQGELTQAQGKLTQAQGELTQAQGELTQAQSALTQAQGEQQQLQNQLTQAQSQVTSLRAKLPISEGGTADPEAYRQKAASTVKHYVQLRRQKQDKSVQQAALQRLEQEQQQLAKLTRAKAIHTVRRGESLSALANKYYRDSQRWKDIYQANQHVLSNPDGLEAGYILVIP
ncbi:LysM peptidoglycan-binding domain-containing protein [Candidatus Venteria ishoeyi]|uniref:LysM peptidoglycan-binding domain-containing protein n=1 Tax=Candidatus Venteria ishoeyi TaxID=1899563 RepID=UPI0025A5BCDE|nr:LysM peptidoglycan-binding domain-containing protein [Candidatus Venteria ishoeyi]MDM8547495.1 LysM peptidoglycan-binding domain-containing protein [Candidatus Venteria ishoeyi]